MTELERLKVQYSIQKADLERLAVAVRKMRLLFDLLVKIRIAQKEYKGL